MGPRFNRIEGLDYDEAIQFIWENPEKVDAVWIVYTLHHSRHSFSIFLSFLVIAFVSEGLLQRYHGRRILAREHWEAS